MLIQNAIVLWNTLRLSEVLLNTTSKEARDYMLAAIKSGSLLTWQHVNMQGECDFRQIAANDSVITRGETAALEGRTLSHEDAKSKMQKWLR